ncbi:hypothetical protein [Sphingosinicella terrae]|uniref:hypothetical protein n=1 Tax=Sphingosinicella terrae TaxID=2172047 RepID=UPI0025491333|nr:hypothetical protein [Sphingosinicella terrae]
MMRRTFLPLVALAGAAAAASPPVAGPSTAGTMLGAGRADAPQGRRRLPGFAAELAGQARIAGPSGWAVISQRQALAALAAATPRTRQRARWNFARSLVGSGRAAEALGVLDVMLQDDPDLALVPAFQLARGAVFVQLDRRAEALSALAQSGLEANAEACLWRLRAYALAGAGEQALAESGCAAAALASRPLAARTPFVAAASSAALDAGRPAAALRWLAMAPPADPAADLWRGRILLALGRGADAQPRLRRVEKSGNSEQRLDAGLSLLEAAVAQRRIAAPEALRRLEHLRFVWRGGSIEERALRLSYRLYRQTGDTHGALAAGATLVRYFDLADELPGFMGGVQADLAALLAADSRMPLPQAAGLFWDYRDLAPGGGEGDQLVERLSARLQHEGLYARAAELLEHRLRIRDSDITQGPLSVRVATLHILAGRPDRGLAAIRATEHVIFPREMLWDRSRIQAVALHQLGRHREALAVLQDVPGSGGLRSELLWKQHDWNGFAAAAGPDLPGSGALSEVGQAVVLRYAIALGMLGREAELAGLRARYQEGFSALPTAGVFDVLTSAPGSVDAEALTRAMAAIPAASPAGRMADLLDLSPRPGGA